MQRDKLRFLVIGSDWSFPPTVKVPSTVRTLTRKDGTPLELSLLDFVAEDAFNEPEKAVACYLDTQEQMFFWYRNRPRLDYAIQGWQYHRIYPDFIFTTTDKVTGKDYQRVYVVETKGWHLKDNEKTAYVRKLFKVCMDEAERRDFADFGREMEGKVLRYEVLAEDEWQATLNALLQA